MHPGFQEQLFSTVVQKSQFSFVSTNFMISVFAEVMSGDCITGLVRSTAPKKENMPNKNSFYGISPFKRRPPINGAFRKGKVK